MKLWTEMQACASRAFCVECRNSAEFRAKLAAQGRVASEDFACPVGITAESARRLIGSKVEKLVKPIAQAIGLDCLDGPRLKPASPCAKRRDWLNTW